VLASWIIQIVSKSGSRRVQATLQELYTGTMTNPYLRHYFHMFLWYKLSFYQAWAKEYDDWNISIKGEGLD
jgi:hypothetical protein